MKKILLSIATVFLTMGAMAQTLDLTFNKVSANEATVNVAGNDIDATGITASITANYAWKELSANSETFPTASILCPDKNTSQMSTGSEGVFTITLNNVPKRYLFKNVTFTSAAINGSGEFQADNAKAQHVNFTLAKGETTLGTVENIAIKVNSNGGESVEVPFNVSQAYSATDGTLVLTLTLSVTESYGCFYGLTKISIEAFKEPIVETGKFYSIRLTPTMADSRKGAIMSIDNNAKLYCVSSYDNSSKNIFTFENHNDALYMKSVHTNTYISNATWVNNAQIAMQAEELDNAANVTISELGTVTANDNEVEVIGITPDGGQMLNCAGNPGNVVGYNNTAPNKASAWYLTEVTDFKYTLEVGTAEWATVVLGFNATIPTENFKAYTIASEEDGYVTLEEVAGVLAANVPVIVNATPGNYDFVYTTETATVTSSRLQGTLYDKDITATGAYVLSYIDTDEDGIKDEVGFYIATTTGKAEGTFTNNANKAYFVPTNAQANITSYSFRFGEGTTGISEVKGESENAKAIYDLTGRRVENITAPGIYIINGVKVLVK